MRETENINSEQAELNDSDLVDKNRFSLEDWNTLTPEERKRQSGLLSDVSHPDKDEDIKDDEEERELNSDVNDSEPATSAAISENNETIRMLQRQLEDDVVINDSVDEYLQMKLDPRSFEQLKRELIQEQEQQLLGHLKPEQFVDKAHYESTIDNIRKQIESHTDRIIENQKMQVINSHPMRRQIDNLRGMMGLMGIDLSLEAAEALAVMADKFVKEHSQVPQGKVVKSQAFVEGAGKKVSQATELSQAEKEMLNKLNLSPSTYLKYR
jgi:hypothetical protein